MNFGYVTENGVNSNIGFAANRQISQFSFIISLLYGKNPYHRIVYGLFTSAQEIFSSGNACVSSFFIASIKIYSVP